MFGINWKKLTYLYYLYCLIRSGKIRDGHKSHLSHNRIYHLKYAGTKNSVHWYQSMSQYMKGTNGDSSLVNKKQSFGEEIKEIRSITNYNMRNDLSTLVIWTHRNAQLLIDRYGAVYFLCFCWLWRLLTTWSIHVIQHLLKTLY